MIPPRAHIARMAPYALAQMQAPAGKSLISLAQNESFRPPSPLVLQATTAAMTDVASYPDPDWQDLRAGLSNLHGIDPDLILCGAGSLDLIGCLLRVYAGPDRAVLAPAHAYPFFRTATQMTGARFDTAPEDGTTASVDALLNAVTPETCIVCIANPGNPTGTRISRQDLIRLRDGLRDDILLIIDEAYGEFADGTEAPMWDQITRGNTVVLRTFSKAYGLAGCRVGWGLFPPAIAKEMRKVMNPNNVSVASQSAANAALQDQAYMQDTCRMIETTKAKAIPRLRNAGIAVGPSYANFLLLDFANPARANAANAALQTKGVFLRPQGGAGLPHCLRMTIGPADAVETAVGLLERKDWETGT